MSFLLGILTLAFLALLLLGKILSGVELRSLDQAQRNNQNRMLEIESELETSRKRYLISLKAEGVAKHKLSQVRVKLTSLKQHFDQIQMTAEQQRAQKEKDKEGKLEALVLTALGGTSVRKDTHFKRVMKVISQLIDVEEQTNSEELLSAIQKKIAEMGQKGAVDDTADSVSDRAPESEAEADGVDPVDRQPVQAQEAPETPEPQVQRVGLTRKQLVEGAIKKKK